MKRFNMIDDEFICENCQNTVTKLNYSARDHCNRCLCSKHVDILPGDRKNNCHGLLKPIAIEKFRNTYKIVYECEKCKEIHKNVMAEDDNMDLIIELSKNY